MRSISCGASRLSARASPHTSTSWSSGCSRSASEAALTVCSADTTRTPSGTISSACCAAEPCQTPSMRVALPATAAASGTVASISSCPALSASWMLASVSDWLRKGTLRITISAARAASRVVEPAESAVGHEPRARSAVSAARAGVARADRDRHAGARQAHREPEAERAGGADHRDRLDARRLARRPSIGLDDDAPRRQAAMSTAARRHGARAARERCASARSVRATASRTSPR